MGIFNFISEQLNYTPHPHSKFTFRIRDCKHFNVSEHVTIIMRLNEQIL